MVSDLENLAPFTRGAKTCLFLSPMSSSKENRYTAWQLLLLAVRSSDPKAIPIVKDLLSTPSGFGYAIPLFSEAIAGDYSELAKLIYCQFPQISLSDCPGVEQAFAGNKQDIIRWMLRQFTSDRPWLAKLACRHGPESLVAQLQDYLLDTDRSAFLDAASSGNLKSAQLVFQKVIIRDEQIVQAFAAAGGKGDLLGSLPWLRSLEPNLFHDHADCINQALFGALKSGSVIQAKYLTDQFPQANICIRVDIYRAQVQPHYLELAPIRWLLRAIPSSSLGVDHWQQVDQHMRTLCQIISERTGWNPPINSHGLLALDKVPSDQLDVWVRSRQKHFAPDSSIDLALIWAIYAESHVLVQWILQEVLSDSEHDRISMEFVLACGDGSVDLSAWLTKLSEHVSPSNYQGLGLAWAALNGHRSILQRMLSKGIPADVTVPMIQRVARWAAIGGHQQILQDLFQGTLSKYPPGQILGQTIFCNFWLPGSKIPVLEWMSRHGFRLEDLSHLAAREFMVQCRLGSARVADQIRVKYRVNLEQCRVESFQAACYAGYMAAACKLWVGLEQSDAIEWDRTFQECAWQGEIAALQWLSDKIPSDQVMPARKMANLFASRGYLHGLIWLRQRGDEMNYEQIFIEACLGKHKYIVEWLASIKAHLPHPLDGMKISLKQQHLDLFDLLCDRYPSHVEPGALLSSCHTDLSLHRLLSRYPKAIESKDSILHLAAMGECDLLAQEQERAEHTFLGSAHDAFQTACDVESLDGMKAILKLAEHVAEQDAQLGYNLAKIGSTEILVWVLENCQLKELDLNLLLQHACSSGNLMCVLWILEHYPDLELADPGAVLVDAASNDMIHVLQWLHAFAELDQDAQYLDESYHQAIMKATKAGHVRAVKWLSEHSEANPLCADGCSPFAEAVSTRNIPLRDIICSCHKDAEIQYHCGRGEQYIQSRRELNPPYPHKALQTNGYHVYILQGDPEVVRKKIQRAMD